MPALARLRNDASKLSAARLSDWRIRLRAFLPLAPPQWMPRASASSGAKRGGKPAVEFDIKLAGTCQGDASWANRPPCCPALHACGAVQPDLALSNHHCHITFHTISSCVEHTRNVRLWPPVAPGYSHCRQPGTAGFQHARGRHPRRVLRVCQRHTTESECAVSPAPYTPMLDLSTRHPCTMSGRSNRPAATPCHVLRRLTCSIMPQCI